MSETKKSKKVQKQEECPEDVEYAIKPEKGLPAIDTSSWPLLLKVIKSSFKVIWTQIFCGQFLCYFSGAKKGGFDKHSKNDGRLKFDK